MEAVSLTDRELDQSVDTIASFIAEMVDDAGADGVVLGLSGGVDSATVAGLATEAVGPSNVRALHLIAGATTAESTDLAGEVADTFGLDLEIVDVEPLVEATLDLYPEDPSTADIGNVRARARMLYWYLAANDDNRLVLGGGNRTEWLVGYFTKYGDAAVDCLPIGDLYKGEVRQLAHHLDVPEPVVTRAPTAELWDDQTDEGELGIDYEVLDVILAEFIDGTADRTALIEQHDIDPALIDRVERLVEHSAHKRSMPPTPAIR